MGEEHSVPKIGFETSYKKANFFSKLFFHYAGVLIKSIRANDMKMTEEMIEDMTLEDDETEKLTNKFIANLKARETAFKEKFKRTGKKESFYYPVRNAIWDTFKWYALANTCIILCTECLAIGYTSFLVVIINFIQKPSEEGDWKQGILLVAIFGAMMAGSSLGKNT